MTSAFYYAKEVNYRIPVESNLPPMPYMRFAYTFNLLLKFLHQKNSKDCYSSEPQDCV